MGTLTTVNKELGGSISLHISHISLHKSQSSFSSNMLRPVSLLAVASLAHTSPLSQDVSLPAGCKDYTVGECNPEADELIDTYEQIPDGAVCQTLCGIQEGCNYFRHSKANKTCTLHHYRFLTSCNLIAGPVTPTIDECTVDEEHSCDSFIRENCEYQGDKVLEKGSITDQHACQDLLAEIGEIYGAVYFMFDNDNQNCVLYSSKDMECDAISGPKDPAMDTCDGSVTTKAPASSPKHSGNKRFKTLNFDSWGG